MDELETKIKASFISAAEKAKRPSAREVLDECEKEKHESVHFGRMTVVAAILSFAILAAALIGIMLTGRNGGIIGGNSEAASGGLNPDNSEEISAETSPEESPDEELSAEESSEDVSEPSADTENSKLELAYSVKVGDSIYYSDGYEGYIAGVQSFYVGGLGTYALSRYSSWLIDMESGYYDNLSLDGDPIDCISIGTSAYVLYTENYVYERPANISHIYKYTLPDGYVSADVERMDSSSGKLCLYFSDGRALILENGMFVETDLKLPYIVNGNAFEVNFKGKTVSISAENKDIYYLGCDTIGFYLYETEYNASKTSAEHAVRKYDSEGNVIAYAIFDFSDCIARTERPVIYSNGNIYLMKCLIKTAEIYKVTLGSSDVSHINDEDPADDGKETLATRHKVVETLPENPELRIYSYKSVEINIGIDDYETAERLYQSAICPSKAEYLGTEIPDEVKDDYANDNWIDIYYRDGKIKLEGVFLYPKGYIMYRMYNWDCSEHSEEWYRYEDSFWNLGVNFTLAQNYPAFADITDDWSCTYNTDSSGGFGVSTDIYGEAKAYSALINASEAVHMPGGMDCGERKLKLTFDDGTHDYTLFIYNSGYIALYIDYKQGTDESEAEYYYYQLWSAEASGEALSKKVGEKAELDKETTLTVDFGPEDDSYENNYSLTGIAADMLWNAVTDTAYYTGIEFADINADISWISALYSRSGYCRICQDKPESPVVYVFGSGLVAFTVPDGEGNVSVGLYANEKVEGYSQINPICTYGKELSDGTYLDVDSQLDYEKFGDNIVYGYINKINNNVLAIDEYVLVKNDEYGYYDEINEKEDITEYKLNKDTQFWILATCNGPYVRVSSEKLSEIIFTKDYYTNNPIGWNIFVDDNGYVIAVIERFYE